MLLEIGTLMQFFVHLIAYLQLTKGYLLVLTLNDTVSKGFLARIGERNKVQRRSYAKDKRFKECI